MNKRNQFTPVNREYKDTMFRMIFRDKKELLSLYNAVNHSHYTDAEMLQVVTLENAIYMNMKNDLAFLVDCHLYLYEHQSTYNPNIPLRNLFYVAKEYEKLVTNDTLYSSRLIKIPAPHFIVFYNGVRTQPEMREIKLSDAYYSAEDAPALELKVTMLNINSGNNAELLEQCETLRQYMLYVERVRKYAKEPGFNLQKAVEQAVNECIEEGILSDFLKRNKAEAINMSIFEYNEAEEKEKIRKAEYSVGWDDGWDDGQLFTIINLAHKKYLKGCTICETADMLETEPELIKKIYETIETTETDDLQEIFQKFTAS
ncbi:MAG: hypothetical protein IJO65_08585 [Lachnospiraceae bacterium]|nr:hypothetical protein [Lachnospiraceae bacterium]